MSGAEAPAPTLRRRRWMIVAGVGVAIAAGAGTAAHFLLKFPPDTTPEGAYLRITYHLSRGEVRDVFPYLEDAAQHAAYTIRDYRKKASDLIRAHFPADEQERWLSEYRTHAEAPDGSDVWVDLATTKGWLGRLRRDLSGIASVEIEGERATVVTARGTRYPFRRRDNGIWGLTVFTAELVMLAERAARDFDVVKKAADDYAAAAP